VLQSACLWELFACLCFSLYVFASLDCGRGGRSLISTTDSFSCIGLNGERSYHCSSYRSNHIKSNQIHLIYYRSQTFKRGKLTVLGTIKALFSCSYLKWRSCMLLNMRSCFWSSAAECHAARVPTPRV